MKIQKTEAVIKNQNQPKDEQIIKKTTNLYVQKRCPSCRTFLTSMFGSCPSCSRRSAFRRRF